MPRPSVGKACGSPKVLVPSLSPLLQHGDRRCLLYRDSLSLPLPLLVVRPFRLVNNSLYYIFPVIVTGVISVS